MKKSRLEAFSEGVIAIYDGIYWNKRQYGSYPCFLRERKDV